MENNSPDYRAYGFKKHQSSESDVDLKNGFAPSRPKPQGMLPRTEEYVILLSAVDVILNALLLEDYEYATKITDSLPDSLQIKPLKQQFSQLIQKLSQDKQVLAQLQKQQAEALLSPYESQIICPLSSSYWDLQIKKLAQKLEEQQRKKSDIQNQLKSVELLYAEQIQDLKRQKEILRNELETLRKQEALRKQKEQIKSQNNVQSLYDTTQRLELLKRESIQVQDKISLLKKEQFDMNKRLQSLRNELSAQRMKMELLRKEQIKQDQKAFFQNLSLRQSLSLKQDQLKQKHNMISSLHLKVKKYQSENNNQSQIIDQIFQSNSVAEKESKYCKERNDQLQKELENMRKMYEQCLQYKKLLESEKQKMKTDMMQLQQEAKRFFQMKVHNLESNVSRLREELGKESMMVARNKVEAEEHQQKMTAEIDRLEQQCASLKAECERSQKNRHEDIERQRREFINQVAQVTAELHEERRQHLDRFKERENEQKRMRQLEIRLQECESAPKRGGTEIQTGEVTYEEVLVYLNEFWKKLKGADRIRFKGKLQDIGRN